MGQETEPLSKEVTDGLRLTARAPFYVCVKRYFANTLQDFIHTHICVYLQNIFTHILYVATFPRYSPDLLISHISFINENS